MPTVEVNINAIKDSAYIDTAARTSVAGRSLFEQLKNKGSKFTKVIAEITLADGEPSKKVVYATITNIIIGKRYKRIRLICLPYANNNRTLLGIDFLEQAGMVLDLSQRLFYFKDEPHKKFPFVSKPPIIEPLSKRQDTIEETAMFNANRAFDFLRSFDTNKDEAQNELADAEYNPAEIEEIFQDSIRDTDILPMSYSPSLFPPLKRVKPDEGDELLISSFEINSLNVTLQSNEDNILSKREQETLNTFLKSHQEIFENISNPIKNTKHFINTDDHSPISTAPYRISPSHEKENASKDSKDVGRKYYSGSGVPMGLPGCAYTKKQ